MSAAENKHTLADLHQMQMLSLNAKVAMTKQRIKAWVEEYGEDGVYVSFSGGKDSTVLLTIVREMYPDIPAVFFDTGLEYPEIRDFVRTWDNVEWVKPKLTFKEVIEKYGYPFISKEVAECVYGARKYLQYIAAQNDNLLTDRQTDRQTDRPHYLYEYQKLCGLSKFARSDTKMVGESVQKDPRNRRIFYFTPNERWRTISRKQASKQASVRYAVEHCRLKAGGSAARFANFMGISTKGGQIDTRLWKGYRQSQSTEIARHQQNGRQSDSGDYP